MKGINKFPSRNPTEAIPTEHIPELLSLTGVEDEKDLLKTVRDLREEMRNAPKVGRTFEETSRREVTIPLTSHEQKHRLLEMLSILGIYPWEEQGLLIIDHHKDIQKLELSGIIAAAKEDSETGVPPELAFPLPSPENLSTYIQRKKQEGVDHVRPPYKESPGDEEDIEDDQDETEGIDKELVDTVNRFDQGLVDEDDPVFKKTVGSFPSLKLFPRRYIWQGGHPVEARSGKIVSDEGHEELLQKAREGDDRAFRELSSMHRGLVLSRLLRVREKFGGDPDDLFQEGMIGLLRAVQLYSPVKGARFSTYATYHIEARMRNFASMFRRPITVPISSEIPKVKRSLYKAREMTNVSQTPEEFGEAALKAGVKVGGNVKIPDDVYLDKLERTYLLGAAFDPVSDEEDNSIDASRLPKGRFEEVTVQGVPREVFDEQLYRELSRALLTLSPREERIIRMRFGLGHFDAHKANTLDFTAQTEEGMTLEEVGQILGVNKERVRQIEAKALRKMKHPARAQALSELMGLLESGRWHSPR